MVGAVEGIGLAASIWTLMQLSEKVIGFLSNMEDAQKSARMLISEVLILNNLLRELDELRAKFDAPGGRQSLTTGISRSNPEHLVAVLTGCFLTLSELANHLETSLPSARVPTRRRDRVRWVRREKNIDKILSHIQNQKTSLALALAMYNRYALATQHEWNKHRYYQD